MHAAIDRYARTSGSLDDLAEAGYVLGTRLSRAPGFVAALSILAEPDDLITIRLFQDQATLESAGHLVTVWATEYPVSLASGVTEMASGELVAQKGL